MNESKVRGLKWNLKKVRGSVLHFSLNLNILFIFIIYIYIFFAKYIKKKMAA